MGSMMVMMMIFSVCVCQTQQRVGYAPAPAAPLPPGPMTHPTNGTMAMQQQPPQLGESQTFPAPDTVGCSSHFPLVLLAYLPVDS
jgi:hypothetical protein